MNVKMFLQTILLKAQMMKVAAPKGPFIVVISEQKRIVGLSMKMVNPVFMRMIHAFVIIAAVFQQIV